MTDYLNVATENELVFRAIVATKDQDHETLATMEFNNKFSAGDRSSGVKINYFEKGGL